MLHAGITDEMQNVADSYERITITVEKISETIEPATKIPIITTELALVIVASIAAISVASYWMIKRK